MNEPVIILKASFFRDSTLLIFSISFNFNIVVLISLSAWNILFKEIAGFQNIQSSVPSKF